MAKYGIEPVKDFLPYITAFFAWMGSLNWILILSVAVAIVRAWIAYKECKIKERIEDAKANDTQTKATQDSLHKEEKEN